MNNKIKIIICLGSSCYNRGNQQLLEVVKSYLAEHNLKDIVDFKGQLCSGNCSQGPVLHINGIVYKEVDENVTIRLLDEIFAEYKQ